MILSVEKLKSYSDFAHLTDDEALRKITAVESLIRAYTNNNFQNRNVRFVASSSNGKLDALSLYLRVGDNVQISKSLVNDGIYTITSLEDNQIGLNEDLYDCKENLVTKVEYPPEVIEGAINLLRWDIQSRNKVGIQSESISRHSVTYFSQDASNSIMGYPAFLMTIFNAYKKARF